MTKRSTRLGTPSQCLLALYCLYLLIPIYWLFTLALQSNNDILGDFSMIPENPTLDNFIEIWTNPVWYQGFLNSLTYVLINTLISLSIAIPAAYTFSRYQFLGDRQLFFLALD